MANTGTESRVIEDQLEQSKELAEEVTCHNTFYRCMTKASQKYLFLPKIKESKIMKLKVEVEKNEVESIGEPVAQISDQETLALYKEEVDKVAEKLHSFSPRADAEVDLELQSATFETYYNSDDKYTKTPFLEDLGTVVNAAHGDWWNKNQRKSELKLLLDIGQYSSV